MGKAPGRCGRGYFGPAAERTTSFAFSSAVMAESLGDQMEVLPDVDVVAPP